MTSQKVVWDDGQTRIERSSPNGKMQIVITEGDRELYRGPVPEGAAREQLDPRLREKLAAFMAVSLPPPPAAPAPPTVRGTRPRSAPPPPPAAPPSVNEL